MSDEARLAATPLPCGKCVPCRINKARVWQHRILLEAMCHSESSFITLTYNEEVLPIDGSLNPDHITLFLKRLRKRLHYRTIRYFICGEYGSSSNRPHYHACLFGVGPLDQVVIEKSWGLGFIQVGDVTEASANYMCKYVTKSMTQKDDNRLNGRHPEFMRCSKQDGGLGLEAIKQIASKLTGKPYMESLPVIRQFLYGKRNMPLGRYLIDKLSKLEGADPGKAKNEFHAYQDSIFEAHLKDGEIYLDNVLKEKENERNRMLKRSELFKQKRSI